jgi:hypothetical protein
MLAINYEVRLTDLAIVCATVIGPILAVQVQKYLERWREDSSRRTRIFKTLMATRAARLAPNHVEALNMINVEFSASDRRFKKVRSAWKAYFTHLGEPFPDEVQQPVYLAKRNDLFTDLLYEMGTALGYDFDKTEISKEVYSTVFQEKAEADANSIREKLAQILNGKAAFPMSVVHFPLDEELATNQSDYMKIVAGYLRDGKPLPITIVGGDANSAKVVPTRQADQPDDSRTA